jgi:hypothetical protein
MAASAWLAAYAEDHPEIGRIGKDVLSSGEEPSGEKVLRLIRIRLATPRLEEISLRVKPIRNNRESPIPVPETQSVFHRCAR